MSLFYRTQTADHSEVYALMFSDSKIVQHLKCKRTKLTYLINDAITHSLRKELVTDMTFGTGHYSLCIDESNDCLGSSKFFNVIVSFVSGKEQKLIVCS
jgi:hypothetical protein